jgi:hypothetical protein
MQFGNHNLVNLLPNRRSCSDWRAYLAFFNSFEAVLRANPTFSLVRALFMSVSLTSI